MLPARTSSSQPSGLPSGGLTDPDGIMKGSTGGRYAKDEAVQDHVMPERQPARRAVRVAVSGEHYDLEKHDAAVPDHRHAAEDRQHHPGRYRLDHEQEEPAEKHGRREQGNDHGGVRHNGGGPCGRRGPRAGECLFCRLHGCRFWCKPDTGPGRACCPAAAHRWLQRRNRGDGFGKRRPGPAHMAQGQRRFTPLTIRRRKTRNHSTRAEQRHSGRTQMMGERQSARVSPNVWKRTRLAEAWIDVTRRTGLGANVSSGTAQRDLRGRLRRLLFPPANCGAAFALPGVRKIELCDTKATRMPADTSDYRQTFVAKVCG